MTVQDSVPTVSVPQQAGPADPPSASAPAPAPAPLLGRDRPLTADERSFAIGLTAMLVILGTIIVVGLLLGQYAWS